MSESNGRLRTAFQALTFVGVLVMVAAQLDLRGRFLTFIEEQAVADFVKSTVTHNGRPMEVVTYRRQVEGEWETDAALEARHDAMCAQMADP